MGIISKAVKKAASRVKKPDTSPSPLPKKPSTPAQRAFGGGRRVGKKIGRKEGAVAGVVATGSVSAVGLGELFKRMKNAQSESERAATQAEIEKQIRRLAQEDAKAAREELAKIKAQGTASKVSQSPRPKARPEGMAKGGAVHRMPDGSMMKGAKHGYNKGGYANCGASMKATQKSTMACGGMVHKKK